MQSLRVRSILSVVLFTLLAVACLAVVRAAPAIAASADISVSADNPPPPSVPTGQASTYTINFTCSAVSGNSCGANPTITIPLDVTSSNPATPDPSTWAYSTASTISGLITSQQIVGGNLVITLNESALQAGQSDTIQLSVTPPNNITPDNTTWQIEPSFQTDAIPAVAAPAPAEGAATAAAMLSVTKNTNDGGSVYVVGNNVIFNIVARCNPGGATGNLYLTNGSLVDALPPELTFVSATPAPTTAPAVGATGNIEWDYPTAGSLPAGCASGASGTTAYTVTAKIDPGTPNNDVVDQHRHVAGHPARRDHAADDERQQATDRDHQLPGQPRATSWARPAPGRCRFQPSALTRRMPATGSSRSTRGRARAWGRPRACTRSASPTRRRGRSRPTSPTRSRAWTPIPASSTRRTRPPARSTARARSTTSASTRRSTRRPCASTRRASPTRSTTTTGRRSESSPTAPPST